MHELRTVPVYSDADRAVYVVAAIAIREMRERDYAGWYASADPVALVIIDGRGSRAVDLEGNATDVTALRAQTPSLAALWPTD